MTLYQCSHVTVARPAQQIALPVTGNGTIFDFRRSFADGDSINDPALGVSVNAGVPRAADPPLGSQMSHQLLFQRTPRLNEQGAINRFVRHTQALILRILSLQPSGNLLRRPVLQQFTRNDLLQLAVGGQPARLGPQGRLPGLPIGLVGSILRAPAMAVYLSGYRGESATQMLGDDPHRAATGNSAGDVFAFGQGEYPLRTTTSKRSDPSVTRQQKLNDPMVLPEYATNRM